MKFYNFDDAPYRRGFLVCRHSRLWNAMPVLILGGLTVLFLYLGLRPAGHASPGDFPSGGDYCVAAFFGLFAFFFHFPLRASFHAANWLMYVSEGGLIIKYRSYLNRSFPPDDLQVVEFEFEELAWARKARETRQSAQLNSGRTATEFATYLELSLRNSDTAMLEENLRVERNREAPKIGHSQTTWRDYPVTFQPGGIVRIHWNGITPGVNATLQVLARSIKVEPPVHTRVDFTHPSNLSPEETKAKILQLARGGDELAAVAMAQRLHGGSLAEARALVQALLRGGS